MKTVLTASCICAILVGVAWADQVTLKNGDRVTGDIIKKDKDNLVIKSPVMGALTIPWAEVDQLRSDKPLNVVLSDRTVQATVETTEGKLELKEQKETVAPADVVAIRNAEEQAAYERLLSPGWGQLWAGTATLGFAGTAGNARTSTFTTALNAARITNNDKTSIYFSAVRASALLAGVSADTAQAVRGGWAYNHNVSPRVFLNVFNDYEYDRFQSLDLRFVIGGGAGYNVWKAERGRLDVLGGLDYNRAKFSPAAPLVEFTRNSAEAYWGDDYDLKLNSATTLVQSFRMFNNLSDTGEYRINFDLGATTKIYKWITWSLGFSDRYLSNPAPGRKTNDLLYTTGIGVTFAR